MSARKNRAGSSPPCVCEKETHLALRRVEQSLLVAGTEGALIDVHGGRGSG
jgi:hypothetical protein